MREELEEQGEDIWIKFLLQLNPLSNIEIANYFNYKPRFDGVFSRNNLLRIKDGAYVINLNDKNSKGAHWISLFIEKNTALFIKKY